MQHQDFEALLVDLVRAKLDLCWSNYSDALTKQSIMMGVVGVALLYSSAVAKELLSIRGTSGISLWALALCAALLVTIWVLLMSSMVSRRFHSGPDIGKILELYKPGDDASPATVVGIIKNLDEGQRVNQKTIAKISRRTTLCGWLVTGTIVLLIIIHSYAWYNSRMSNDRSSFNERHHYHDLRSIHDDGN